jgi:Endosomal/lysosomal potassium channel TMEM175
VYAYREGGPKTVSELLLGASRPPASPAADRKAHAEVLAESGRVEAFSDGVLAIVITLLVLDLRAPTMRDAMLQQLLRRWPAYVAYLAWFAYAGVIWVNHHQLFTRIAGVDTGLLWRNLALLLTTSVLPFPTAVLGSAARRSGSSSTPWSRPRWPRPGWRCFTTRPRTNACSPATRP